MQIAICSDPVTGLILAEEAHLKNLARRLVRCDADVEDLVQDSLLRAFRARARFEPGTSVRAWTATILRRVFLTGVIRAKRRGLATDTDAGQPLGRAAGTAPPSSCESAPSIDALLESLEDPVRRALLLVPDIYRVPFMISVFEGLSCSDIADRLGIPEGTVMSRVHRARERMKRDLVYERYVWDAAPDRRAIAV